MTSVAVINYIFEDENFSSGGEKVNYLLIKTLVENGFDVDVYCRENRSKHLGNINIIRLTEGHFYQTAAQVVRKKYYDLTLSTNFNMQTDFVYLHEHSRAFRENVVKPPIYALITTIFANKRRKFAMQEMKKQKELAQKYKVILTPSTILKNDLINLLNVNGENVYIIPPAICEERNINTENHSPFCFGFVGRGFENKGGFLLLLVLSSLRYRNFKLKIIYPREEVPTYFKYYLKFFGLEKKVEFLTFQSDMSEFYNSIDCLLMPSKRETFGLTATEAMNFGKVVVVSSRCGVKDIIEYGKNGFIFDISNHSIKNLKNMLNYILDNKDSLENIKENAYKTSLIYDYNHFKTEFLRILNKYFEEKENENVFD